MNLEAANHVIRARKLRFGIQAFRQIEAVPGNKRNDGIETLLQMPLRVNKIDEVCRILLGILVAPHRLPGGFLRQFLYLVQNLRAALMGGRAKSGVKLRKARFQPGQCRRSI